MTLAGRHSVIPALGVAAVAGVAGWALGQPETFGAPLGFFLAFVCLGLLPAALARTTLGVNVGLLGLKTGAGKLGTLALVVGVPVAVFAGYVGAGVSELALEYPLDRTLTRSWGAFLPHSLLYLLYYIGFEFLFRGFLLFGLQGQLGSRRANLLQAVLATVYHIGKPLAEIGAAFPASILFGAVALRTGSIWYVVVPHWLIGVSLDWFLLR